MPGSGSHRHTCAGAPRCCLVGRPLPASTGWIRASCPKWLGAPASSQPPQPRQRRRLCRVPLGSQGHLSRVASSYSDGWQPPRLVSWGSTEHQRYRRLRDWPEQSPKSQAQGKEGCPRGRILPEAESGPGRRAGRELCDKGLQRGRLLGFEWRHCRHWDELWNGSLQPAFQSQLQSLTLGKFPSSEPHWSSLQHLRAWRLGLSSLTASLQDAGRDLERGRPGNRGRLTGLCSGSHPVRRKKLMETLLSEAVPPHTHTHTPMRGYAPTSPSTQGPNSALLFLTKPRLPLEVLTTP